MAASVSPFTNTKRTPALDATLAAIRDDVLESVRGEHAKAMAGMERQVEMLTRQIKDLVGRKIEVAAPSAPNVSVSPQIHVPEQAPPDVEVEVDLKEILPVLKEIRDQLKKAQVRTVERDGDGRITKITDRRT